VGDTKDFFIELTNNANSDMDISNWVINANGKIFILPKNSVILSKKQMTISGKITGFTIGDQNNLKLYSGTGELVYDYNVGITTAKVTDVGRLESRRPTSVTPISASALDFQVPEQNTDSPSSSPIIPIASFIFIGASAGAVYFIRRKKVVSKDGDDFEILDE
jgi:hypothetical protein